MTPPVSAGDCSTEEELAAKQMRRERRAKRRMVVETLRAAIADNLPITILEWDDLDEEARLMNRRRLNEEVITHAEYDALIEKRKKDRQAQNICVWDDFLFSDKLLGRGGGGAATNTTENETANGDDAPQHEEPELHFVIESQVNPTELELKFNDDVELAPACRAVRSLSVDSDESEEDADDPASDGMGGFLDFVYRRALKERKNEQPHWQLHTVDPRDLGDVSGMDTPLPVKEDWIKLFDASCAAHGKEVCFDDLVSGKKSLRCDPATPYFQSPDVKELEQVGLLGSAALAGAPPCAAGEVIGEGARRGSDTALSAVPENDVHDLEPFVRTEKEAGDFFPVVPSFEWFFGETSELLYYSQHIKALYSPFLAFCVKDLQNWEQFFTQMFLGGRIEDALRLLDLTSEQAKRAMHVRSPVLAFSQTDVETGKIDPETVGPVRVEDGNNFLCLRDWDAEISVEENLRDNHIQDQAPCSFLPLHAHLTAKGGQRTWSSDLFAQFEAGCNGNGEGEIAASTEAGNQESEQSEKKRFAMLVRDWTLERIRTSAEAPKENDDRDGGGEWFLSYLRAVHREVGGRGWEVWAFGGGLSKHGSFCC